MDLQTEKKKLSSTTKGIFFIIASAFFFALMAVFVRLSGDIHFVQKGFFRNAVAFLIALSSLLIQIKKEGKQVAIVPKESWKFLFMRAIAGSVGIFGNFYAIDHLVLPDAAILNKMSPFFAIIFSIFIMKEKVKPVQFITIFVAFLGSVLVMKPSFNFSQTLPSFVGFLGGLGAGFAYSCVRKLSEQKCNGKIVILFFSLFSSLLSVPYMICNFNPMTWKQLLFLIGAGVCAAGGQFTITAAYYHAKARDVSIYDYSQIIFSTILGFVFFGQVPDVLSFVGYAVIILMAILNFLYIKHFNSDTDTTDTPSTTDTH